MGMAINPSTFDYHAPTHGQIDKIKLGREAAKIYAAALDAILPEGEDKESIFHDLRTMTMAVNFAITHYGDGTPRD
jgi:hypothetical protein